MLYRSIYLATLLAVTTAVAKTEPYDIIYYSFPDDNPTLSHYVAGFNNSDEFAGQVDSGNQYSSSQWGFELTSSGAYTKFPEGTAALGINNAGYVVGQDAASYPFVRDPSGNFTQLNLPISRLDPKLTAINGYASGITASGAIVGYFQGYNNQGYIDYGEFVREPNGMYQRLFTSSYSPLALAVSSNGYLLSLLFSGPNTNLESYVVSNLSGDILYSDTIDTSKTKNTKFDWTINAEGDLIYMSGNTTYLLNFLDGEETPIQAPAGCQATLVNDKDQIAGNCTSSPSGDVFVMTPEVTGVPEPGTLSFVGVFLLLLRIRASARWLRSLSIRHVLSRGAKTVLNTLCNTVGL